MPNQFDVVVADPLSSIESYRQEVSRSALLDGQAQVAQIKAKNAPEETRLELNRKMLDNQKLGLDNRKTAGELVDNEEFQANLRKVDPSLPVVDQLGAISSAALRSGRYKEAEGAIKVLDTITNHESMQDARKAREELARTTAGARRMDRMLSLMQGMNDPTSKALMEDMYKQEFGVDAPTKAYPYSPMLKDTAIKALQKAKSEGEIAATDALTQQRIAAAERAAALGKAQVEYYQARTKAVQEKVDAGVKSGGKGSEPSKSNITYADEKLKTTFPDLNAQERKLATLEIAADAKAIQLRDAGSYEDAVAQAIEARRGQFLRIDEKLFGFGAKAKTSYMPKTEELAGVEADMKKTGITSANIDIGGKQGRIEVKPKSGLPQPGEVYKGWRYKGPANGDRSDRNNWEKVNG